MNTSDFAQRLADKLIAQLKEGMARRLAKAVGRRFILQPIQPGGTDIEASTFWR